MVTESRLQCSADTTTPDLSVLGIELSIPGFKDVRIEHLVLDFNGTLALDGVLRPGVSDRLIALSSLVDIHIVSADTFNSATMELGDLPVQLLLLPEESQAKAKRIAVLRHGSEKVIAIGNGRNDQQMIATAAIGIAVIQREGAAGAALISADVVVTDILQALDLLLHPKRLIATLRA